MKAQAEQAHPLVAELAAARRFLLHALEALPEERWSEQPSAAYSPVGWHAGHVAAMQARWLLPGEPESGQYGGFFDPLQTGKAARAALPGATALRAYLKDVHDKVCHGLEAGRLPAILGLPETFLVQHVAQHELQHAEHIQVVAALCRNDLHRQPKPLRVRSAARLEQPGGKVQIGNDDAAQAYDNEQPRHSRELEPHWLDRAPVTAAQFAGFIEAGGYRERKHWTEEGWDFVQRQRLAAPLGFAEQEALAPVTCLSWYEADAYARFRGARLPTEFELEAAGVEPAGVWEWTSSWFLPYPGFRPYPYEGYSVPWFGTHRVLRGASWATSPSLQRSTLRNWYEPAFRELPSGFRCAGSP